MAAININKPWLNITAAFIANRLLIVAIGFICYSTFPERGKVYQEGAIRQSANFTTVWHKFDSHWYVKLAQQGYPQRPFTDQKQETWGFMPLYPLTIKLTSSLLGIDLFYAGLFVSNICTLLALLLIFKFIQQKFKYGVEAIMLILTCAGSFYLSIVYAEGLFILLTALVFYLSHQQKYGWALVIAGLASVTRIQGCLLFIIPGIEILTQHLRTCYKFIPAFLISLLPMAAFMFYLNSTCGEPLAFLKIQHAWGSTATYPLQGIVNMFTVKRVGSSVINIGFWLMILFIVLSQYRKLPLAYVIFTVLYFLLSTSNEMVYGTTRYMLGVLPLFVAICQSSTPVKQLFIMINLLFLGITIAAFVTNSPTFI